MKFLFIFIFPFQLLFSQNQSSSGYVVYQVSLTESFYYSDEYKKDFLEGYQESIKRDSLMNGLQIGVVFNEGISHSFQLKDYIQNSSEYNALYKANGVPDYQYDSKTKISKIYLEYWLNQISITVNLNGKWNVNYKKTKTIDGYKCYYAEYSGKGLWWELNPEKPTFAWFTSEIPLPYGPLHYNALPGLILELNVENVRYTATKIGFDETHQENLISKDVSRFKPMTEQEFIEERSNIRKRAKKLLIGH